MFQQIQAGFITATFHRGVIYTISYHKRNLVSYQFIDDLSCDMCLLALTHLSGALVSLKEVGEQNDSCTSVQEYH